MSCCSDMVATVKLFFVLWNTSLSKIDVFDAKGIERYVRQVVEKLMSDAFKSE